MSACASHPHSLIILNYQLPVMPARKRETNNLHSAAITSHGVNFSYSKIPSELDNDTTLISALVKLLEIIAVGMKSIKSICSSIRINHEESPLLTTVIQQQIGFQGSIFIMIFQLSWQNLNV